MPQCIYDPIMQYAKTTFLLILCTKIGLHVYIVLFIFLQESSSTTLNTVSVIAFNKYNEISFLQLYLIFALKSYSWYINNYTTSTICSSECKLFLLCLLQSIMKCVKTIFFLILFAQISLHSNLMYFSYFAGIQQYYCQHSKCLKSKYFQETYCFYSI